MDTGKLKRFATEARTNLMDGVRLRLRKLGFDERGHAVKAPELISGGTIWNGEEYPEEFHSQWMALRELLLKRGVREVVETAAYTWFNRMIAIRILTRNGLCDSILDTDEMTGLPRLLAEARMGRVPDMTDQQRRRYEWLMKDDMRTTDQFAVLLTAWCHTNPLINSCFGSIDGFVELLLPDNILKDGGFLSLLNHTEFITDEDFHSAELIGWLYQFYISDRKDEVFAKRDKVEADEIPAATQIFTPNWIVKYMVQNTIIPQVDAPEEVVEKCKYLVKADGNDNRKVELEDMKVADFACGSGHILNECFDLLYDLYKAEAYSRREAIESIFTKNMLGIDIDLRAKQLATFALLLKACQKDSSFADAHCMPRVLTVPEFTAILKTSKYEDEDGGHGKHIKHVFFQDSVTDAVATELEEAFTLLMDADSLGSIIKFNLSASALRAIKDTTEYWQSKDAVNRPEFVNDLLPAIDFIMALTDSYDAIVMNPPYMPTSRVDVLRNYTCGNGKKGKDEIKAAYPDSKADLFSVFMDVCIDRLKNGGKYGMINMQSWMFLSSFEALRKKIIEQQHIDSLLHLGPHTFDELSGEVVQNASFVIAKEASKSEGVYYRLVDGNNCKKKKYLFKVGKNRYVVPIQSQFMDIPGARFGYWMSTRSLGIFKWDTMSKYAKVRRTLQCGDVPRFTRFWFEVNNNEIATSKEKNSLTSDINHTWFHYSNGGESRKWYGNLWEVVNWQNNGELIKSTGKAIIPNEDLYFLSAVGFNRMISTKGLTARHYESGILFGDSTAIAVSKMDFNVLAIINSKVCNCILDFFNPRAAQTGSLADVPVPSDINPTILNKSEESVNISKSDWDAHETSWDFKENELIRILKDNGWGSLENVIEEYQNYWERLFKQLHANEEEINRQFIDIYGLQDELNPHVDYEDITILQQGEISLYRPTHGIEMYEGMDKSEIPGTILEDEGIVIAPQSVIMWQYDVIIKQLISYIVGVWMGRYRLDRPGLHIAHPNPTEEELAEYPFSITGNQTLKIDADAIIPILPSDAPFYDNLRNYVVEFVRKVWGDESLTENINFIEKSLGKSLDDYLMKDFWKYHKKMYQNRPIYWEFASKKGAFRAIVYAHLMDRYTVEVLRSKYLLPYIGYIERKIAALELRQNELTTAERRELDNLRTKTLPELREYHDRVERVAAETAARPTVFDLDDGIIRNHALFGDIVTKLK